MGKNTYRSLVRIIPRLDIKGPNLVKGISFDGFRVLGAPEDFSRLYCQEGADELIYYDTVASLYQRNSLIEIIRRTADYTFVPLTVAGGLRSVDDVRSVLRAGADKVAINTAAVANPKLITDVAKAFGSQCMVLSIEAKRRVDGAYEAWVDYGRQPSGINAVEWAKRGVELGAGEILVTSIDREGSGYGFDLDLVSQISKSVPVPVIASGGAGKKEHIAEAAVIGEANAVSIAAAFHYHYCKPFQRQYGLRMGKHEDTGNVDYLQAGGFGGLKEKRFNPISIPALKAFLLESGVAARLGA